MGSEDETNPLEIKWINDWIPSYAQLIMALKFHSINTQEFALYILNDSMADKAQSFHPYRYNEWIRRILQNLHHIFWKIFLFVYFFNEIFVFCKIEFALAWPFSVCECITKFSNSKDRETHTQREKDFPFL